MDSIKCVGEIDLAGKDADDRRDLAERLAWYPEDIDALTDKGVVYWRVTVGRDDDEYYQHPETAIMAYLPDIGRWAIAWGSDPAWGEDEAGWGGDPVLAAEAYLRGEWRN